MEEAFTALQGTQKLQGTLSECGAEAWALQAVYGWLLESSKVLFCRVCGFQAQVLDLRANHEVSVRRAEGVGTEGRR